MARIKKAQDGLGFFRTGDDMRLVRSKSTPRKQKSVYKTEDNNYRMTMTTKPRYQTPDKRSVADETKFKERRTLKGMLSGAPTVKKRMSQESIKAAQELRSAEKSMKSMKKGGKMAKQLGRMKTTIGNRSFTKSKKK